MVADMEEVMTTKKFYIVWNEARNEGFITDDEFDASLCARGEIRSGSTVGIAFSEAYDDDERVLQEVLLPVVTPQ